MPLKYLIVDATAKVLLLAFRKIWFHCPQAFSFSPDGSYLVGVCSDSKVHVWEPLLKNPHPEIR